MKTRLLSMILAASFALSLAGCAGGGGSPAPWQRRQCTAQGAGELVIYTPNPDAEIQTVIPAFEQATGIKVIVQSMATGDVLARLDAERKIPRRT